jgi:hypothetical protein
MTPTQAISQLDRMIARNGEAVTLVRPTTAAGGVKIPVSVVVNAIVRGYQAKELIQGSGIQVGDSRVIISPSQINAKQWPGGYVSSPTTQGDMRVPKGNIDQMIVAGKTRQVIAASPTYLAGELVRIDVTVR